MSQSRDPDKSRAKKLRTACDICHQAKMKCSGGNPCSGCGDSGYECSYSVSNRIGRPKGTKNKRTLERMSRTQGDTEPDHASNQAQDTRVSAQDPGMLSGFMTPSRATGMASVPRSNGLSESAFGSNFSYPQSRLPSFDHIPRGSDPWYDCGSAALPNLLVWEALVIAGSRVV